MIVCVITRTLRRCEYVYDRLPALVVEARSCPAVALVFKRLLL